MRPNPRSIILAAALIAPATAFTAACGDSDHSASAPRAKAVTTTSAAVAPSAAPTLASQLERVVAAGSPGVIGVVNDGHGVKLQAAGVADKASGRALRATDRFRAGSNTKTLAATVALQLVGEGKLKLSDTVERWLPGILPYGDEVNLRQLLNMTGGIPDYVPAFEAQVINDTKSAARPRSPRQLVAMVAGKRPDFPAGKGWNYSTTNYILIGMIIERATGHRFASELDQRIVKPLRLRHTSLPGDTRIKGSHAHGYGLVKGQLLDLTNFNASAAWAGGGLVTTATDMTRYWRALLGGKLLAPAQLAAMKTTVTIKKGFPARYGLGLMQFKTQCGTLWGNGGDLPGFSSEFYNSEDGKRQAGVIVNVNPIPKAVAGEPLGQSKTTAIADALGREHC